MRKISFRSELKRAIWDKWRDTENRPRIANYNAITFATAMILIRIIARETFRSVRVVKNIYTKNNFKESKILLDTDLKIILLDHQNNFLGTLKIRSNIAKNSDILATSLSILHKYFDQQNHFSDLYPAKILDLSIKPFFPRMTR